MTSTTDVMVIQGRELHTADLKLIRGLLSDHPQWSRRRLSEELCRRWDWRNAQGRMKDMACRTLLLKLERADLIRLPKRRGPSTNELRNRHVASVAHATDPIGGALRDLRPLRVSVVGPGSHELGLLNCLLDRYHYLGHRNTVGENIRYLARDRRGRPLGCVLFGSAAWTCMRWKPLWSTASAGPAIALPTGCGSEKPGDAPATTARIVSRLRLRRSTCIP